MRVRGGEGEREALFTSTRGWLWEVVRAGQGAAGRCRGPLQGGGGARVRVRGGYVGLNWVWRGWEIEMPPPKQGLALR